MATDVNKLIIQTTTKGVKESKKEIDDLTTSSKKLGQTTKDNTKTSKDASDQQGKFTTATTKFRNELPNVASGLYLVQQAYGLLSGAMGTVMDAYELQYTAEVKLQTILQSTSNSIGKTYDEVVQLSKAWEGMTGINDAVILEAAAIGATFTQISKEVFPDLIEQALNMSTIFRQDLKQSIISLGVATNNLQVSRLTRIGISFTDQQKEQIRVLRESGQVLEAQQVIMRELEVEIGAVAKAMGQTSLAAIDKYQNAWQNLFEELGEISTNWLADLARDSTGVIQAITKSLGGINDVNTFRFWENADISDSMKTAQLDLATLDSALEAVDGKLLKIESASKGSFVGLNEFIQQLTAAQAGMSLDELQIAFEKERELIIARKEAREQFNADTDTSGFQGVPEDPDAEKKLKDQEAWIKNIRELIQAKNDLKSIDSETDPLVKQHIQNRATLSKLEREGLLLGLDEKVVNKELYGLLILLGDALDREIKLTREANKVKEEQALINGVLTNSSLGMVDAQAILEDLFLKDRISVEAYTAALMDLADAQVAPDKETISSWDGLWDKLIFDTETAIDWTKSLELSLQGVAKTVLGIGVSGVSDVFANIGESLRDSNEGALTFEQSMLKIIDSTLEAIGPQLMLAGAMHLASPNPSDRIVGWGLLLAGGGASILGGFIDSSFSNSNSNSSGDYSNAYSGDVIDPTNSLPLVPAGSYSGGMTPNTNIVFNDKTTGGVSLSATTNTDGSVILDAVNKVTKAEYNVTRRTIPVSM